jgi:hypothetical protein
VGLSPKSWNATLFYDDGKLQRPRLRRLSQLVPRARPGAEQQRRRGHERVAQRRCLDLVQDHAQLEVVLEGVNLTNEPNDQFISRARNSVVAYTYTGREYLIGIRAKF